MCPFDINPQKWNYFADENGYGMDSGNFLEFKCINRRKRSYENLWDTVTTKSKLIHGLPFLPDSVANI